MAVLETEPHVIALWRNEAEVMRRPVSDQLPAAIAGFSGVWRGVAHAETQLLSKGSNLLAMPLQDVLGWHRSARSGLRRRRAPPERPAAPKSRELIVVVPNLARNLVVAREGRTFLGQEGLAATLHERPGCSDRASRAAHIAKVMLSCGSPALPGSGARASTVGSGYCGRGHMLVYGLASGPVAPFDISWLSGTSGAPGRGSLRPSCPSLNDHGASREELIQRSGDVFRWIARS
jgi:hypothetical protein